MGQVFFDQQSFFSSWLVLLRTVSVHCRSRAICLRSRTGQMFCQLSKCRLSLFALHISLRSCRPVCRLMVEETADDSPTSICLSYRARSIDHSFICTANNLCALLMANKFICPPPRSVGHHKCTNLLWVRRHRCDTLASCIPPSLTLT